MYCEKCGAKASPNFCTKCGNPIPLTFPEKENTQKDDPNYTVNKNYKGTVPPFYKTEEQADTTKNKQEDTKNTENLYNYDPNPFKMKREDFTKDSPFNIKTEQPKPNNNQFNSNNTQQQQPNNNPYNTNNAHQQQPNNNPYNANYAQYQQSNNNPYNTNNAHQYNNTTGCYNTKYGNASYSSPFSSPYKNNCGCEHHQRAPYHNGYGQTPYNNAYYPFKEKLITLILCIFLGIFGAHRFYTGKYVTGVLYFLTGGLFGIGYIVDIVLILTNSFTDRYHRPLV